MQSEKNKICFFSLSAYPLFDPSVKSVFGGAELRMSILANELAKSGVEVSVITYDHGQKRKQVIESVTVIASSFYEEARPGSILKKLQKKIATRFIAWKYASYIKQNDPKFLQFQSLLECNANYYGVFQLNKTSLQVVEFCKRFNRKVILFIASDAELNGDYIDLNGVKNPFNVFFSDAKYLIDNAHRIFVQNEFQLRQVKRLFGKDAVLLKNPAVISSENNYTIRKDGYVLWIGKSDENKRPELLLKLASEFPKVKFKMIMSRVNDIIFDTIVKQLPSNVELVEYVPSNEIDGVFGNAIFLINTSKYEGFPNTFLQAAKNGVPVLSMIANPDNFIVEFSCGKVCGDSLDTLKNSFQEMIGSESELLKFSANIHDYVTKSHNPKHVVSQLLANL